MFHLHCWHKVNNAPGYRIKIKRRCRRNNESRRHYIRYEEIGPYILCVTEFECCICGKKKFKKYLEYDTNMAMQKYSDIYLSLNKKHGGSSLIG